MLQVHLLPRKLREIVKCAFNGAPEQLHLVAPDNANLCRDVLAYGPQGHRSSTLGASMGWNRRIPVPASQHHLVSRSTSRTKNDVDLVTWLYLKRRWLSHHAPLTCYKSSLAGAITKKNETGFPQLYRIVIRVTVKISPYNSWAWVPYGGTGIILNYQDHYVHPSCSLEEPTTDTDYRETSLRDSTKIIPEKTLVVHLPSRSCSHHNITQYSTRTYKTSSKGRCRVLQIEHADSNMATKARQQLMSPQRGICKNEQHETIKPAMTTSKA